MSEPCTWQLFFAFSVFLLLYSIEQSVLIIDLSVGEWKGVVRRISTGRLPVLLRLAKLLLAAILAVFSCLYLLLAFSLHDFRAAKHVIIKACCWSLP